MSRSIRALASSAFKRAISICSALTALPASEVDPEFGTSR
jgi:hypothetical protein